MNRYISKYEIKNNNLNKLKVKINNKKFIKQELKNSKILLDNINGYSLDVKQRLAIITNEDNNLIIAGAGSGKTLTIVGKIRYLIERLNVSKEEILCISFTNDSVNSLKCALSKNYNYDLDIFTFHKLALNIIRSNNLDVKIAHQYDLEYIIDEFFYSNVPNLKILKKENINKYIHFKNLIITFINLFKSNNYKYDKFDEFLDGLKYCDDYIFIKVVRQIYLEYQAELKSKNEVDFNDMINNAINIVKNDGYIKQYKYIIIDEYQDTSLTKYELIKEIKRKTKAKLFAVGDDFQSIYRFTGCNLDIFLNFDKYYGFSKIMKIENTYRNSRELINIAGKFIMKNKKQMRKRLRSNKRLYKPLKIVYFKNQKSTFLKLLLKLYDEYKSSILILGRNNKDIYNVIDDNFKLMDDGKLIYTKNNYIHIRYLTMHKSKGLEDENVIIINLQNNNLGFPSKIESNKVLHYVLHENDYYPYEEERRLFYVALTRTKNNVYLLVNKDNPSIFVKELIKNYRLNIQIINELL
ncbi:MAG: UvrD-helicase domain-containing protein [Bacilli bacterium]|nr:UvrD-helicase domain-containing protein [Bacilli bacterium]